MYQKKGCKMTNQEIATKVSQLINYNVNKEGVTCKEFAARKKLNYKLINAYGNGTRIPRLYNYKKRLVKDVSLLHAIIIIECFNLNFKIPGLID